MPPKHSGRWRLESWTSALALAAIACLLVGLTAAGSAAGQGSRNVTRRAGASPMRAGEEPKSVCTNAPGTGRPPEKLGPYTMTEFEGGGPEGLDPTSTVGTYLPETQINSPAGVVKFSETLDGKNDESYQEPYYNWLTWSNGYEGQVWWNGNGNNGESSYFPEVPEGANGPVPLLSTPHTLTITLPEDTRAFYVYVEPYPDTIPSLPPNYADVTVTAPEGGQSGPTVVQGFHGAQYFGCYNEEGLKSVSVSSDSPWGFAIGELGISAVKYVAMGDSFSSGEGVPPFTDGTSCHRSELAYPELLEHGVLEKLPLAFVACSGATTVTGQNQFKSLSKNTKVVTASFGGDDLGFAEILKACIVLGCEPAKGFGVKAVQNIPQRIAQLKSTLVAAYREIKADAPNAAVYILGYPYLFPPHPGKLQFCLKKGFLFPGDLADLASWEIQLDEAIEEAVAATGGNITYVNPNNLYAGHDVCSPNSWFNALGSWFKNGHHQEYLFHPTEAGQVAFEQVLYEAGIGSHANDARRLGRRAASSARASAVAAAPVAARPSTGAAVPSRTTVRSRGVVRSRTVAPSRVRTPSGAGLRSRARTRSREAAGAHLHRAGRGRRTAPAQTAGVFGPLTGAGSGSARFDAAGAQASGTISGTVTDAVTGEGLPGICVYAYELEFGGGYGEAETAADGTYTVEGELPTGSYTVEFWPCGNSEYVGQYYDDQTVWEDATPVAVVSGQATSGIDAAMARSGIITGRITDAVSGEGVEGVCVTATASNYGIGGGRATSGPGGTYAIRSNLTAGSYRVSFDPTCDDATASSYLRQYYNGASTERSADAVEVAAGTEAGGIDAALQQSATISGEITSATGEEGVNGVCVTASSTDGGPGHGTARTAPDGSYTISTGLYSDSYAVNFDPSCGRQGASAYLSQYYREADRRSGATTVAATAGDTTGGIDGALQTSARIAGIVTAAGSKSPVAGVCVTATPTGTGVGTGTARTAGDGTYTISSGLRTGTYAVEFDPSCSHLYSQTYAGQFYDEAATSASATLVSATADATTAGVDAELKPPGTISGAVTAAAGGSPLSGVCVEASATDGGSGYEASTTTSAGSYSIAGLPAGSYEVNFDPRCGVPPGYSAQLYGEEGAGAAQDVTVSSGESTEGVDAALASAGSISGTVTDAGSPQEGVCVYASSASPAAGSGTAMTAGDGTYSVSGLRAGSYTIDFDPSCAGFTHASALPQFYADASGPGEAEPVSVPAGADVSGIDADLQAAGGISGDVTDAASGSPSAGTCVTASPAGPGGSSATATTHADGSYAIAGLAAGGYEVEFDPTCNGTTSSSDAAQYFDGAESPESAATVAVTAGADTGGVNAALQEPGEITGKITDAKKGTPLAGVCVEVMSSDSGPGDGFATTAADGTYSVAELPPDSYIVEFEPGCDGTAESAYGAQRFSGEVAVAAGQTRTGINGGLSSAKKSKAETTTGLQLSVGETTYGDEQVEQFSVTVSSAAGGEPTGTVKVLAGSKTVCKIGLTGGTGSCSPAAKKLKPGSYSIAASYKGSKVFAGSASGATELVVAP